MYKRQILFKPLTKDNISHIVDLMVADVNRRLEDRELKVELTDNAKTFVTGHGYDPAYGARPLRRYLQKDVYKRQTIRFITMR